MAIHLPEEKKWTLFLNAATNSKAINVFSVDGQEVSFNIKDHTILSAFNSPDIMKANIIHAHSNTAKNSNTEATQPYTEQLNKIFSYSGIQIINDLIAPNFLESHNINLTSNECSDNIATKIITCDINKEGTKTVLFKQKLVNFGYLQSMLRDPEEIREVLMKIKPILTEDYFTGEDSDFSQKIITIDEISNSQASVKLNYGHILKNTQDYYNYGAPVIYSSNNIEEEFTINKNALLNYMYKAFPSGVIFTETNLGKLQPIMFQPISSSAVTKPTKTSFDISLDRSGSMRDVFSEYQKKIIDIITQITNKTANWSIALTAFDDKFETQLFDSNANNALEIVSFVNSLSARGATSLYNNMVNRLNSLKKMDTDKNPVLIIFTDGHNNGGSSTANDVTDLSIEIRESNPQFSMYTMGYGPSYTTEFFEEMSSNGGFTHIHLSELDQIEEFNQYINTINNCKVVYSFENGAAKFFEQCAAGDIAISSTTISHDSILRISGDSYSIGTEA